MCLFELFQENPNATDSEGRLLDAGISYLETWKAMEECVQLGLTKSIGVSNFNIRQLKDILGVATIKPVVNQVNSINYNMLALMYEILIIHRITRYFIK